MNINATYDNAYYDDTPQFGGEAYPKFGQAVILAGGAGSGKGFVLNHLLSIEGKVFDDDKLKKLSQATLIFAAKVKAEMNIDIKTLDTKNPDNTSKLHEIISDIYKLDKKLITTVNRSVLTAHPDRKPNLIFDVTLKDLTKLHNISETLDELGYEKKNTHLVWVMNKFDVAVKQNRGRKRVVSDEIMFTTHEGAALTMAKVFTMGKNLRKYMDGDIFISFNQTKVDDDYIKSDSGGAYIAKANYIQLKKRGKTQTAFKNIEPAIHAKIAKYIPKTVTW